MITRSKGRRKFTSFIVIVLTIALAMPMSTAFVFGDTDGAVDKTTNAELKKNIKAGDTATWTSEISGEGLISMIRDQEVKITFDVAGTDATDVLNKVKDGEFYLYRDEGCMDTEIYPYQFVARGSGNGRLPEAADKAPWKLTDWVQHVEGGVSNHKVFSTPEVTVTNFAGGVGEVEVAFDAKPLLRDDQGDITNIVDGATYRGFYHFIEMTGDYKFEFRDAADQVQAETSVRYAPYESYRTMPELEAELKEAEDYINNDSTNDMYAEVRSMGKSTYGLDMPYIVITKEKKDIANYEALMEEAEANPTAVLNKVNSGALDYKVPILYDNIHSNEFNGVDSIIDFVWDIAKTDEINYKTIDSFNANGEQQLEDEMDARGAEWTDVLTENLPADKQPTGIGYLTGEVEWDDTAQPVNMTDYYNMQNTTLNVNDMLDDVILIVVPEENVDGRTWSSRQAYGGVDINRDNLFQAQKETQNMTKLIASWNPVVLWEQHGFVANFQVEPCTPPHEPNFEYDLIAENSMSVGEAYGNGAISNNTEVNSFKTPLRDYYQDGEWYVWDDDSTGYTPQYSMLHGTVAFTVEVPGCTEEQNTALKYGLINNAKYVADNKEDLFVNQVKGWERGVKNIDADSIKPWYEDMNGVKGAEADIIRPKFAENNNYFPEYYVIPNDDKNQKNLEAAKSMQKWLINGDVKLDVLDKDMTVNDADGVAQKLPKGSIVVDMHQAKRNVANAALSNGQKLENWGTSLYSEPVTNFPELRGFDCHIITKEGALDNALTPVKSVQEPTITANDAPYTIIMNSGNENVKAVNKLLYSGADVGLIDEGDYKGHFITKTSSYNLVKDTYTINAEGTDTVPVAKLIDPAEVHLMGGPTEEFLENNGQKYGGKDLPRFELYEFNYSNKALTEEMGFKVSYDDPAKADVIVGCDSPNEGAYANLVKDGKPFVGWTTMGDRWYMDENGQYVKEPVPGAIYGAAQILKDIGVGEVKYSNSDQDRDAVFEVEYPGDSLVTDHKKYYEDDVMYNMGCYYIDSVPAKANVLIKGKNKPHLAGSMQASRVNDFQGKIQAFEYEDAKVDMTLFAGQMFWKNHQRDDSTLVSTAIYQAMSKDGKQFAPEGRVQVTEVATQPQATEIKLGQKLQDSMLYGWKVVGEDGKSVAGEFQWANPSYVPEETGNYEGEVKFTPTDNGYSAVTGTAIVNVVKADEPVDTRIDLGLAQVTKIADQTHSGSAKTPAVKLTIGTSDGVKTLVVDQDFTAAYSENVEVGPAKVALTAKDGSEYKGVKNGTFTIIPKNVSKLTVKVAKKKKIKITWAKVAGVTKYQIRYKQSGKSKWKVKTVDSSKSKLILKKLKKGKKYNVQIRTYKTVKGVNYTSPWSKTKTSKKVKK